MSTQQTRKTQKTQKTQKAQKARNPQGNRPTPATMASQLRRAREAGAAASERAALAERIGEAVTALPDVAGLSAGPHAHVVTYRIGPPFAGVAVREAEIEVGVVARRDRPVNEVAETVRRAVLDLDVGDRPVHVLVADIEGDGDEGGGAGTR
jgi:hypothetical protein